MDDQVRGQRSAQDPDARAADAPENVAVTGVAKGALGTDTALEDTQEWVVPAELRPRPAGPAAAAPASAVPAPPSGTTEPPPEVVPVQDVRPTAARRVDRRPRGGFAATPRAAGLAAAVLLALVGVAAVVTSQDRVAPGAATTPAEQATAAPTIVPPAEADGGNGGGGNEKKDKGGGNGKGNGGGGKGSD